MHITRVPLRVKKNGWLQLNDTARFFCQEFGTSKDQEVFVDEKLQSSYQLFCMYSKYQYNPEI